MKYSTTKTYTLKRSVIEFGKRIFKGLTRPDQKFGANMIYGMLAAKSCLLTSIVDQLHERTRKVNAALFKVFCKRQNCGSSKIPGARGRNPIKIPAEAATAKRHDFGKAAGKC